MNIEDIIEEPQKFQLGSLLQWIDQTFKEENFGWYNAIKDGRIWFEINLDSHDAERNSQVFARPKQHNSLWEIQHGGYECFISAYLIKQQLTHIGLSGKIKECETDIWDKHFVVEIPERNILISATPDIPKRGFKCRKIKDYDDKDAETNYLKMQKGRPLIDSYQPIKWARLDDDCGALIQGGLGLNFNSVADSRPDQMEFRYKASLIKAEEIIYESEVKLSLPKRKLLKLKSNVEKLGPDNFIGALRALMHRGGLDYLVIEPREDVGVSTNVVTTDVQEGIKQGFLKASKKYLDVLYYMLTNIDGKSIYGKYVSR